MKTWLLAAWLALAMAIGVAGCQRADPLPQPVEARIKLDNRCELVDDAFMIVVEPSGQRAHFRNGVAWLKTASDQRVKLAASSEFPGMHYDGGQGVPVKREMVLVAECNAPDRVERMFDAWQKQFSPKR
jgi:hypothetical protein